MSFSAADILSEFTEAASHYDPNQLVFEWQQWVADRHEARNRSPERRARSLRDYYLRKARPMTRILSMAKARKVKAQRQREAMLAALAECTAARRARRARRAA